MDDRAASNPELLAYLEKLMVSQRYDVNAYLRVLLNTSAYQREVTRADEKQFYQPVFNSCGTIFGRHGADYIAFDTHDDAERIRERLLWRLQQLREAMGLTSVHPGS